MDRNPVIRRILNGIICASHLPDNQEPNAQSKISGNMSPILSLWVVWGLFREQELILHGKSIGFSIYVKGGLSIFFFSLFFLFMFQLYMQPFRLWYYLNICDIA